MELLPYIGEPHKSTYIFYGLYHITKESNIATVLVNFKSGRKWNVHITLADFKNQVISK